MRCEFHADARSEYLAAVRYYSAARQGLGAEFTREVEAVVERICRSPEQCSFFEHTVRGCRTHRFPYAILYIVEEDCLFVVAVMHGSRQPGYWRKRIAPGA